MLSALPSTFCTSGDIMTLTAGIATCLVSSKTSIYGILGFDKVADFDEQNQMS